jgi:hypothetical protein
MWPKEGNALSTLSVGLAALCFCLGFAACGSQSSDNPPPVVSSGTGGGPIVERPGDQPTAGLTGQPAQIQFEVSREEIAVKGSGGTETTIITISVLDKDSRPIVDVPENIEMLITSGPNGGECLDGTKLIGQILSLTTRSGKASAVLQSGYASGTVLIEVRVVKNAAGEALLPQLTAAVPRIAIRSGRPASVRIERSNAISSPGLGGNGTLTHDYLAYVTDSSGNAVPDRTSVYFGQFVNVVADCRTITYFDPYDVAANSSGDVEKSCADGAVVPPSTFTSPSANFLGVSAGDILVLLTEDNAAALGGYRVGQVVDGHTLMLEHTFSEPVSGLEWAVGNNTGLGGSVFTTGEEVATEGGVARWSNTYSGHMVNAPVYVFAEVEGLGKAQARHFRMSWAAPTGIRLASGFTAGSEVPSGSVISYAFVIEDASPPTPYPITRLPVGVSVSSGTLILEESFYEGTLVKGVAASPSSAWLATTPRVLLQNKSGGGIAFKWQLPATPGEYTLQVSAGGSLSELKIKGL